MSVFAGHGGNACAKTFKQRQHRVFLGANLGNTYKDKKGYPRWSDSGGLVHRDVARNMYGPLGNRVVHHNDGDKSNFRKNNLTTMSRSNHSSLEAKRRRRY